MHEELERLLRHLEPLVALEMADGLLTADPKDSAACSCRIRSLWMLRRADEARAEMEQGFAQHGAKDAALQVAHGVVALGLRDDLIHVGTSYRFSTSCRDDAAAEESFRVALALEPANVEARRGLATALRLVGRRDEALEVLTGAAAEIGQAMAPALLVERAWCEFDLWHLEGAVEWLDRVLIDDPADLEALYAKAFVLRVATDETAARIVLNRIEELAPNWRVPLEIELGAQQADVLQLIGDSAQRVSVSELAISRLDAALKTLPGHPAAWSWRMLARIGRDEDGNRPHGPCGLIGTADSKLALRNVWHPSWPELREGLVFEALTLYRQVLAADPLLAYARCGEAECLWRLGRLTEARQAAEAALALVPRHGLALAVLALVELDAEQPERALDAAKAAGLRGGRVLPRVWLDLGFLEEAEAAALAEIKRVEHVESDVRFCLFYCAYSTRRYPLAVQYAEAMVKNAPTLQAYRRWRASARRRCWSDKTFGWFTSLKPEAHLQRDRECESMVDEVLPGVLPLRVRGRLRSLARRQSNIANRDFSGLESLAMFLLLAGLAIVPWTHYFAGSDRLVKFWESLAAMLGGLAVAWAAGKAALSWFISSHRALVLLVFSLAAGAVWLGTGARALPMAEPAALVLGAAALIWTLFWAIEVVQTIWARRATFRLRRGARHAALIADLCDLLGVLRDDRPLALASVRRDVLCGLDLIAEDQYHVMLEATGGPRRRLMSRETAIDRAFRQHAAGVAAATRDLKRSVLSPGSDTWANLKTRVVELLEATAHGWWERYPYRKPDPVTRVLLAKVDSFARRLVVISGVPAMVAIIQYSHVLKFAVPVEVQFIAYVVWPLAGILMLVDPTLPAKVTAANDLRSLLAGGDQKNRKSEG